ncbi:DUF397 domain-containing protein [Nocardia terpenica]|uniref:DUF397 domain-containing protein n=1 Tax=Nocardia terpenica TaxID=455432 RepID=A0A6G9YWY3_9NOCA|nr:DUF397 domain-containing protein [Nocardia terpenica]QIS17611.1 DUF397 domain-containing protein [Nocardia terpenica]
MHFYKSTNIHFYKSTYSGGDQTCVEVAHRDDVVLIRDSKYAGPVDEQPVVSLSSAHWTALLDLASSNASGQVDSVTVSVHPDGGATITGRDAALVYTPAEWDAFTKGVADGQFDRRA